MFSNLPSKRYLIGKPASTSWKSICEHSRKHHAEQCWCHNTAMFDSVSHRKWFRVLSIILNACLHVVMKLPHHCYVSGWTTNLCHYFPKPITTDCVKCFKVMYRSTFCFWHFSCSCLAVKIMSIVPLSFLNPHWLSGISPAWSRWAFRRFNRIFASIFPAIDKRETPLWLSQT